MAESHDADDRTAVPGNDRDRLDVLDLHAGLADLAGLVTGSGGLPEVLREIAGFATRATPGADGAGVIVLGMEGGANVVETVAASAPFVAEIDAIQYKLNQGPCITAALENRTVRSGSLSGERMWHRFGPRVGRLGIHSSLSLPLVVHGRVTGTINVYARAKDAFDEHAERLGELFAGPAAVAVYNAQVLARAVALAAQLQTALASRPVIDQAIGVVRARTGGSAEEAFDRLRTLSQSEHTKLADVAQRIVDEAVRRARARHT